MDAESSDPNGFKIVPELVDYYMRGLSEPIRYLLHYTGVSFKDTRIPFRGVGVDFADNWTEQKYNHSLDFPNLPFYQDEDIKITESLAILRHLGRKHNLVGETLKEKAIMEMIEGVVTDLKWGFFVLVSSPNYKEIVDDYKITIPSRLGELNNFMVGKTFVIGSRITYVDFLVYEALDWFRELSSESFQEPMMENLKHYLKRIDDISSIQEYRSRPDFQSKPMFSPVAHFGFSKDDDYKPIPFSYRNFVANYPIDVDCHY